MTIRIGHLSTFYHTAILLMSAHEETERRLGSEIAWRLFSTGPAIVDAFARSELDLAYLGLPPAIIGISRGVKIVCIGGGHIEGTVLAAGPGARTIAEVSGSEALFGQFHGRSIGVPGSGSIHDVILREQLDRYGLAAAIRVKNFAWADLILDALASGEVAAAVGTPALAASVKRYLGGRVLCPASMLWPDNPSYGIVAARQYLRTEPELIARFLELHEEATALLRARPGDAARAISAYVAVADPELVLDTLRISPRYCAALTEAFIASTLRFLRPLGQLGYLAREVAPDEIFDTALISGVHPVQDHYSSGIAAG